MQGTDSFGLIVIGDEILNAHRRDLHFEGIGQLLREHGYSLAWLKILPDDPDFIISELQRSMAADIPVFSCGGIGATPDDYTRDCAAKAANVPLVRHVGAVSEIEQQFGVDAYPQRIQMADLPEGADLIPNPYNRVPGFTINRHHFMPGFPDMAHPMAAWVLNNLYSAINPERLSSVWVKDVTETVLMSLMESLSKQFPQHKLFSLPRLGQQRFVELGYRGRDDFSQAFDALQKGLQAGGFDFEIKNEDN